MVTVKDLTIEYADGTRAVENTGFSLEAGENVALIGANGAGKTSLLLSLVGVLLPKFGEIRIDEAVFNTGDFGLPGDSFKQALKNAANTAAHSLTISQRTDKETLRAVRSRVGLVFQNPDDQLFMPTIYEDAAFGPRSFGCDEIETSERVHTALSRLGIAHLAQRSPLKLSGGEKRLAAIAAVLAMEPEYLLFDEPTAFLDPRAKRNLASILSDLPQGKLIATHDLAFAGGICSRVILLQNGKLAEDGGREILSDKTKLEAAGL